jgi:hypothetical protein
MKVRDIISERKEGKLTKRHQNPTKGLNRFHDAEKANSDYTMFRVGMAVAGTDGKIVPDVDTKSWIGKQKAAFPYTQEEQDMLKIAYKLAGAKYDDMNHGNMNSLELDSTNKVSPVPKRKKNKYGV